MLFFTAPQNDNEPRDLSHVIGLLEGTDLLACLLAQEQQQVSFSAPLH